MARRRSLNRRWSRRSGNLTELDQDSEVLDTENPAWWKNIQDVTTRRSLAQTSYAETTAPILDENSLVDGSELHDKWWDNLDRTNLQSSRRFSTRRSVNPEDAAQESFISEGDDEVSIKKRKVSLRARQKQSSGTENFLKAFDDSDVPRSEPMPNKKRKASPTKSDAGLLQRKIRSRHSSSLADAEREDTSVDTSSDTDIIIKTRPKAFEKRVTKVSSDVYDEILANEALSEINSGKNASRISDSSVGKSSIKSRASFFDAGPGKASKEAANMSEKVVDSNESGFMRPPITGSLRKRLSTISKKLNMTSDESEGDAGPSKARQTFRLKSKENASFNPFDEILSGQLNESTDSGEAANKSGRSSNAATRMSKRLEQSETRQVSTTADAQGAPKGASTSKSQLRETERTVNEEAIGDEEMQELQGAHRRSSSVYTKVSNRRTRDATIEHEELPEFEEKSSEPASIVKGNARDLKRRTNSMARFQLFQDWETSDSEEDDEANKPPEPSPNVSRNSSLIQKTLEVSISRLLPMTISHSRQIDELGEDSAEDEEQKKTQKARSRSLRSRSRALADSAYQLPDKERSASPIISLSESETPNKNALPNTSARQSSKNKRDNSRRTREPANKSNIGDLSNISRKSAAAPSVSLPRIDSGSSISEYDSQEALKDRAKSRKEILVKEKAILRKSIANSQLQNSDQSISEELAIGSQELNSSSLRRSSRVERKSNDSKRVASRQGGQSDESISEEEAHLSEKSNISLSRIRARVEKKIKPRKSAAPTNTSRQNTNSFNNTSDAETEIVDSDTSESMKRSLRTEDRANTSRKGAGRTSSARPNVSKQRIESDESSIEKDAENLEDRNPALDKSVNKGNQLPAHMPRSQNATNRNESSFSIVEGTAEDASTTVPSESIPAAQAITKLPENISSIVSKSSTYRTQKNITDFFPSKFLQRSDNSMTLDSLTSFDKKKLDLMKKEMEMKRQKIAAMRIEETAKKKGIPVERRPENFLKGKKLRPKEAAKPPKEAAKPPKVVDKAYIVNGQVYKRPKLPRPKPWVTDRLYRHLWKQLEPKYDLRTRIKSESFVQQLSEVVALTIRRKKYDSYKAEVDILMKEMARLNIIKTRNDFYDFCYEYLPFDFRVKVTPMLLPGNVRNIPYDPATLHTPILPES